VTPRLVIAAVLVAALCAPACNASDYYAEDADGEFRFALLDEAIQHKRDGQRALWRVEDPPITVTMQRVSKRDTMVRERTLRAVVDAIATRYSEHEVEGSMSRRGCTVAGRDAYCLDGFVDNSEGERFIRRGVLVEVKNAFVLIEAVGSRRFMAAVRQQADLLKRSLEIRDPS